MDADTGGKTEHFNLNISHGKIRISAVIIEDKRFKEKFSFWE